MEEVWLIKSLSIRVILLSWRWTPLSTLVGTLDLFNLFEPAGLGCSGIKLSFTALYC